MIGALLWASLATAAPSAPDQPVHLERTARGVQRLEVVSAGGDVRISAKRSEQLIVDGVRTLGGASCSVRLTGKAPALQLTATDPSGKPCAVQLQVHLPPTVALSVRAGTGNLFVSGMRAALKLQLAQGNAVVGGLFSELDAKLDQGSLSVQGIAGRAHLELEQGNLQMFLAPQPAGAPVAVDFRVASGNASLVCPLPAASLQVHSAAGEVHSTLEDGGPGSLVRVQGELGHGNFTASQRR